MVKSSFIERQHSLVTLILIVAIATSSIIDASCKSNTVTRNYRLLYKGNFADVNFSPDYTKLILLKEISIKNRAYYAKDQLWYENLKTENRRLLYEVKRYEGRDRPGKFIEDYSWHPDNKIITLILNTFYEFKTISQFINIDVNSGKVRRFDIPDLNYLTNQRHDIFSWSPNGERLAVDVGNEDKSGVVIYSFKDKRKQILVTKGLLGFGAWSPDAERVALTIKANIYAPGELWVKDLDTGGLKKIVENKEAETSYGAYAWSPDGNWLLVKHKYAFKIKEQYFYNLITKKAYKVKLPPELVNSQILGWNDSVRNLFIVNKVGLWQVDFTKLPKAEFNLN